MPIQQILPDGKVRIFNKKTGQTADVAAESLGQYNPRLIEDYNNLNAYTQSVKAGVTDINSVPESHRAGVMSTLQGSGFKVKTKADLEREVDQQKSMPVARSLYQGITDLKQKAADTGVGDVIASKLTGGNYGYKSDTFDQSKKLLGQTIAKLYENGRLSDKDRDFYQNEILNISPIGRTEAINAKLDNLSKDVLRSAGYSPEDFGGDAPSKTQTQNTSGWFPHFVDNIKKNPIAKTMIGGAMNVAQDIGTGLAGGDEQARLESDTQLQDMTRRLRERAATTKDPQEKKRLLDQANRNFSVSQQNATTMAQGYSPDIAKPYLNRGAEAGLEVGATADIASHPLATIKAPFEAIRGVGNIMKNPAAVINAVKNPSELVNGAKQFIQHDLARTGQLEGVPQLPSLTVPRKAANLAENATELITGGGPKDYIAGGVNLDNPKSMSKVLLDENILASPTTKGRIIKTQEAMTRSGKNLEKVFSNASYRVRGSDIGKAVEDHLVSKYGSDQMDAIRTITNKISNQGAYDLASNDSVLNMNDVWNLAKNADSFKAKAFNLPNNGPLLKDMSDETARYLREQLYNAVPESQNDLRTYRALRTYMDDVLTDPQGLKVGSIDQLIKFLTSKLDTGATMATQKMYNLAGGIPDTIVPPAQSVKPFNPFVDFKSVDGSTHVGTTTPLEGAIPENPGTRTIKRDMRYKQGNFRPRN